MISFLLLLKLNTSSNIISWRNLDFKGKIVSCTYLPPGRPSITIIVLCHKKMNKLQGSMAGPIPFFKEIEIHESVPLSSCKTKVISLPSCLPWGRKYSWPSLYILYIAYITTRTFQLLQQVDIQKLLKQNEFLEQTIEVRPTTKLKGFGREGHVCF